MFNSVRGRVAAKRVGQLFLENGGVEWDITMSQASLGELPEIGSEARVFVYLYHRDDRMRLYGFATDEERSVFLELLKVDGVGPRQAIRILSGGSLEQFLARLDAGDVDSLTRLPGLGKKTAQKIVLALRGKLSLKAKDESSGFEDITAALVDMGFEKKQAEKAVSAALEELHGESDREPVENEVLKHAIVHLSGPER